MPFFKPPPRTWADYEFQPRWRLGTVIRRETKQNNSWTVGLKEETARDLSLNARQIRGTIRIFQGRPRDLKTRRGDAYIYYDLKKDQNIKKKNVQKDVPKNVQKMSQKMLQKMSKKMLQNMPQKMSKIKF